MIYLTNPATREIRHPDDVKRMRALLNENGYDASDFDIQEAWSRYCEDTSCAGWLDPWRGGMGDDEATSRWWDRCLLDTLLEILVPIRADGGDRR